MTPKGRVDEVGRGCEEEDSNKIEEHRISHDIEVALGPTKPKRVDRPALLSFSLSICILLL